MRKDKGLLPIIEAWMEGKEIEVKSGNKWIPLQSTPGFNARPDQYRIKLEPSVYYIILRVDGAEYGRYVDESLAVKEQTRLNSIGTRSPYIIKKFVQDLDYQSPA